MVTCSQLFVRTGQSAIEWSAIEWSSIEWPAIDQSGCTQTHCTKRYLSLVTSVEKLSAEEW